MPLEALTYLIIGIIMCLPFLIDYKVRGDDATLPKLWTAMMDQLYPILTRTPRALTPPEPKADWRYINEMESDLGIDPSPHPDTCPCTQCAEPPTPPLSGQTDSHGFPIEISPARPHNRSLLNPATTPEPTALRVVKEDKLVCNVNDDGTKWFEAPRGTIFNPTCAECEWESIETPQKTIRRIRINPCATHDIDDRASAMLKTMQDRVDEPVLYDVTTNEIRGLTSGRIYWRYDWGPIGPRGPDGVRGPDGILCADGRVIPSSNALPMVSLSNLQPLPATASYDAHVSHQEAWKIVADALNQAGFYPQAKYRTGDRGEDLRRAYRAWQLARGYRGSDADGIPGKASLRSLMQLTRSFGIRGPNGVTYTPLKPGPFTMTRGLP